MNRTLIMLLLAGVLVAGFSCKKNPPSPAVPPVNPAPLAVEPSPEPLPPPVLPPPLAKASGPVGVPAPDQPPQAFELAEAAFVAGDFGKAALNYEAALLDDPTPEEEALTLIRLAACYAMPGSPVQHPTRAASLLALLVEKFPGSVHAAQAQVVLDLRSQIEKLEAESERKEKRIQELATELEKLKQIDLQRSRPRTQKP